MNRIIKTTLYLLPIILCSTIILFAFHTNEIDEYQYPYPNQDTSWHNSTIGEAITATVRYTTHPYLTKEAISIAKDPNRYNVPLTPDQEKWIIQGSIEEDISIQDTGEGDYGFASTTYEQWNYMNSSGSFYSHIPTPYNTSVKLLYRRAENHFLPVLPPSEIAGVTVVSSAVTDVYTWASNSTKNNRNWTTALSPTASAEIKWKSLGHVLHLIEDMAVPSHTRKDIHAIKKDAFETWAGDLVYEHYNDNLITPIFPSPIPTNLAEAFQILRDYTASNYVSEDTMFIEDTTPVSGCLSSAIPYVSYTQRDTDDYFYNNPDSGKKIAKKGHWWEEYKERSGKTDTQIIDYLKTKYQTNGYIPSGFITFDEECHLTRWHDTAARSVAVAAKVIKLYYTTLFSPRVTTTYAENIANSSASLVGVVHPKGLPTSAYFEWGTTTSYGNVTSPQSFNNTTDNFCRNDLAGLTPNTTYHFRIVATNAAGTSYGEDLSFTTASSDTIGSLTVSAPSGTPANTNSNIVADATDVATLHFRLSASSVEDVYLSSIQLNASGTGHDVNALQSNGVTIVTDDNDNGIYDLGDQFIVGTGQYNSDDGTLIIILNAGECGIVAGSTSAFLVVYNFNGTASNGNTFVTTLSSIAAYGDSSGQSITPSGTPVSGGVKTISSGGGSVTGTISGSVKDAVTRNNISGVTISIYSGSTLITTKTTNSSGVYSASLAPGTYSLTISKTGYITENVSNIAVQTNVTTNVESVLQVSQSYSGVGSISGTIKNAFDGTGVSGATINIRSGIGATSGTILKTATTASDGAYTIAGLNAGNYTAEVSKSGYTTAYFTVTAIGGQTNTNQNFSITPVIAPGQTRIVLTWGSTPSDLDSHLTGPISGGSDRFHVYFGSKGSSTSSPYAELDVDDMLSYGPETITIYQQSTGTYRYSVHNYSDRSSSSSTALSNSGAQVKVYRGSSLVATYNVPSNQEGTLWTVFELSDAALSPINTMTYESTTSNVRSVTPPDSDTDADLIRNLPEKK